MKLFKFFDRRASAPVARERLQILLAHERASINGAKLVALLHKEVLEAISKHIEIDPERVKVELREREQMSLLEIDIEIDTPAVKHAAVGVAA
jgi:cell division topological specificity factor